MSDDTGFAISIGILVGLIALCIFALVQSEKDWQEFKITHECVVVGKTSASTGVGVGMMSNGQMGTVVTTSAGKTGWECNDGVTYWR